MPTNKRLRAAFIAVSAGFLAVTTCTRGTAATATGDVSSPSARVGQFVWHDLVTRDAATSRMFYSALLGWEFTASTRDGHTYYVARSDGDAIGGIVELESIEPGSAVWVSYLAVPDLERAVAQVTSAGGKVLLEPRPVKDYARVAVVTDPQGAPLALAVVTDKLPTGSEQPEANHFFWTEYLAKDGPAALTFYKSLTGFESTSSTTPNGIEYHVLKNDRPRAGLLQIPAQATMIKPHWLPYVRVADPAALATRAEALGGKILMAPRPDLRNGTLTVIADPTGAAIALQKWPL